MLLSYYFEKLLTLLYISLFYPYFRKFLPGYRLLQPLVYSSNPVFKEIECSTPFNISSSQRRGLLSTRYISFRPSCMSLRSAIYLIYLCTSLAVNPSIPPNLKSQFNKSVFKMDYSGNKLHKVYFKFSFQTSGFSCTKVLTQSNYRVSMQSLITNRPSDNLVPFPFILLQTREVQ